MKLVCFSDAHWHFREVKVPSGDAVIYTGDWCSGDDIRNTIDFACFLGALPHKHKIVVPGNHDIIAQKNYALTAQLFNNYGIHFLCDSGVNIAGVNIYGTPWTPLFNNWAFMEPDEDLARRWKQIPNSVDVLLTHGPAFGILDVLPEVGSVGSKTLEEAVINKKPKYHIFGHIHSAHGKMESEHTYFYNVSVCNDDYQLIHKPTIIEV